MPRLSTVQDPSPDWAVIFPTHVIHNLTNVNSLEKADMSDACINWKLKDVNAQAFVPNYASHVTNITQDLSRGTYLRLTLAQTKTLANSCNKATAENLNILNASTSY